MRHPYLSLFLTLLLLVSLASCGTAQVSQENEDTLPAYETEEDITIGKMTFAPLMEGEEEDAGEEAIFLTEEEMVTEVRSQLKERNESFVLYMKLEGTDKPEEKAQTALQEIWEQVLEHTGDCHEGDYLKWQYGSVQIGTSNGSYYYVEGENTYYILPTEVMYYTTVLQEEATDAVLDLICEDIVSDAATEEETIRAAYSWIVNNVALSKETDDDKTDRFTCYGATINGEASPEGMAVTLYRLLCNLGIDCRVIPGYITKSGSNVAHAWNAVKLNDVWYQCDVSLDAGNTGVWSGYLRGDGDCLTAHSRLSELEPSITYSAANYGDPVTPVITKIENTATGISVTWNQVENATKYRVYYKPVGGKYKGIELSGTSYSYTGLKSGTQYIFTVKSCNGAEWSDHIDSDAVTWMAAPVISGTEVVSSGVKLSWKQVTGATKYRVYYKLSGASSYTKFKDTTATSVTVNKLTKGNKYVFAVRAYGNGSWSVPKASSTVLYDLFPVISKMANAATGVKLNWSKVDGASKYRVYYKAEGESSYTKFGDFTTTQATVTGLTSGTKYIFAVKAYADARWSSHQASDSFLYCATPTISKISNTGSGAKVTWNKVTGATGYKVYYKLSGASSYTAFGIVTGTSATVTGLTTGKTYVFTVRAIIGSVYSANKASSAFVYLEQAKITAITNTASQTMTITWNQCGDATGYQIYYSTSSSFTSPTSVLCKGSTATSKKISSLTKNKTYYVKVRAYKTVSGSNSFGPWSDAVSVKISK